MALDADALSRLKVKDLQRELKKRGLDATGLKAALLQRLKEHLQQQQETEEKETTEEAVKNDNKEELSEAAANGQTDESVKERNVENDSGDANDNRAEAVAGLKRSVDAVDKDEEKEENVPDMKKPKLAEETEPSSPQPEDEDGDKPTAEVKTASSEKVVDEDSGATEDDKRTTLRIDNFVRPFTLNAVKALVQELSNFVEDGFWMDAIKTHCYVTYPTSEIAEKTSAALDGKIWPPENGRSLSVKIVDHTAMEVSQFGEANLPSRPKTNGTQATQRQQVTIDEFFQKTETKPVLYYLPLTDEQVEQRKQRQSQQSEGQPRKRRHRGGRKRNRRARFRR